MKHEDIIEFVKTVFSIVPENELENPSSWKEIEDRLREKLSQLEYITKRIEDLGGVHVLEKTASLPTRNGNKIVPETDEEQTIINRAKEILKLIDYFKTETKKIDKLRYIIDKLSQKTSNPVKVRTKLDEQLYRHSEELSLMFNGKATTALGVARGKGEFDPAASVLKVEGVNMFSPESIPQIGVSAAKIFRYAVSEFTKHNSNKIPKEKIIQRIFLDLEDFAQANGIDINSESAMKNFRFKVRKSLDTLLNTKITWTEKVKGQPKSYSGMAYIGKYELRGNSLMIEFTISMAEYLVSLPLIQYPRSLYKLDDRDYNAFAIGEAMCIHYSQDNNVIRQTEGKLKVETLLKYTSFPTYEEFKKNRWSWELNVKEPFEKCLDKLYQCGFLKNWEYCHSGGIEITDEEMKAEVVNSYEKFISLLVKFELNEYEDPKTRAIEIAKKKAASTQKRQARHKTANIKKSDNN